MPTDLDRLFSPSTVAVIADFSGASRQAARCVVANLERASDLTVIPVAVRGSTFDHPRTVSSLSEVRGVDVAVAYLRAQDVPGLVDDAARAGVGFLVVQSAGFAEANAEGRALQQRLLERAAASGVRVIGPNCTGVLNGQRGLATATVPMPGIRAGGASLLVQSGVMAGAVLAQVMNLGTFGAAKVCSLGNKADVDETELLEYLGSDEETRSVGMYLEWVSRPDAFVQVAAKVAEVKPIVVLVGGSTASGEKLTRRHTARPDDSRRTVELVAEAGLRHVKGFTEMLEVCNGLSVLSTYMPAGPRTAVVTLTGSGAVVAVDAWDASSLVLAELAPATVEELREVFPPWLPPENPLDVWPAAAHLGLEKVVPRALEALERDENVDQILAILPVLRDEDRNALPTLLPAGDRRLSKPLVCWYQGGSSPELASIVEPRGVAIATSLGSAVALLQQLGTRP